MKNILFKAFAAIISSAFAIFLLGCQQTKESQMDIQEIQDRIKIRELTDIFANLADTKEVDAQVQLFLEDGMLEFQMGFDGEIHEIKGRKALQEAFAGTVIPAKNVYHLNGLQVLTSYSGDKAEGIAYCQATLVNEKDGKSTATTNYVRYTDRYAKVDGKWYIEKRRTTFLFSESREQ
jgi:ketosteroid isomerase-like protein